MRSSTSLIILVLLAACGDDTTTSATTAGSTTTETGTGGTTQSPTTVTPTTSATSETPTGSGSATDSGTTTTATTSSTTDDSGTTGPLQTTGTTTTSTTATTTSTGPDETTTTTTTSTTGTTDTTDTTDSTTGDDGTCPCPDLEVPLDDGIFVLSDTGQLWKYFPGANQFELLGALGCDIPPPTFSMAVDRLGYAWVQYPSGQLRKVDVTNVNNCTDPGYVPNQGGVKNFGMAFVSNSASDKCDRIYGDEYTGVPNSDFFSIDPQTLQLNKLGTTQSWVAEVTGTGDGRAFLFTVTNPPGLVEIDKTNGTIISTTPLNSVQIGSGLAFAFFGGDFYFFTDAQSDNTSEVTHMDYDDSDNNGKQDLTQVYSNAPLRILGAGVSTCVPTLPQ